MHFLVTWGKAVKKEMIKENLQSTDLFWSKLPLGKSTHEVEDYVVKGFFNLFCAMNPLDKLMKATDAFSA